MAPDKVVAVSSGPGQSRGGVEWPRTNSWRCRVAPDKVVALSSGPRHSRGVESAAITIVCLIQKSKLDTFAYWCYMNIGGNA